MQVWIVIWAHFLALCIVPFTLGAARRAPDPLYRARSILHSAIILGIPLHLNLVLIGMDGQNVLLWLVIPYLLLALLAGVFSLLALLTPASRKGALPCLVCSVLLFGIVVYGQHLPDWSGQPRTENPQNG